MTPIPVRKSIGAGSLGLGQAASPRPRYHQADNMVACGGVKYLPLRSRDGTADFSDS